MKRLLIGILFFTAPTCALAQDDGKLNALYTEFSVGASFIPEVSTKTITITDGVDTATGRINLNYDTALTVGAEVGIAGVGIPEVRLAVGYEFLQARFDSGVAVGTVNGVSGSLAFTRADVASFGIDLDNDVHLVTGNIYYDLPDWGRVTPYLGVGVGAAFIQNADTQLAVTASAGIRIPLNDNIYAGVRYRYYHISGPTDDFGIEYDAISNHSIMLLLGITN
jgi:opacity protein-like surface antigen